MKGNAVSLGILNVSTGSGQSKQFIGLLYLQQMLVT